MTELNFDQPGTPEAHEIPVPKEATQPVVDEVERLLTGVMSRTDDGPPTEGSERYMTTSKSAWFPVRENRGAMMHCDQMAVPGEVTNGVRTSAGEVTNSVRIAVPDRFLSSRRTVVLKVSKITISLDDTGTIWGYDYVETLEAHAVESQEEGLPTTPQVATELANRSEYEAEVLSLRQQELLEKPPKFTQVKLDKMLALLAAASSEDRSIEEGSEEPTLNVY